MNTIHRLALVVAICGLAACAGSGATRSTIPQPPAVAKAGERTQATISIVVPLAGRTTAAKRTPSYVSPNTQSFGVTLVMHDGTAIAPGQQQTQYVNVTSSSPNCSSNGTVLTCTGTIAVPVGSDVFAVAAFTQPNGNGDTLSANQTVPATIAATSANVVPMTLNPYVAAVSVSTPQINGVLATQPAPGSAQSFPVTVTAFDCSGATIVGPGSYMNPISLNLKEMPATLGSTVLSATTVNAPSDVVSLSWTGSNSTEYAMITPSTSVACRAPRQPQFAAGAFLPHPEPPYLWTSQFGNSNNTKSGYLVGYPLAWLHNAGNADATTRPGIAIVNLTKTFRTVAADHAGNVYVDTQSGQDGAPGVDTYAPGATFGDPPAKTAPSSVFQPSDLYLPTGPATIARIASTPAGALFVVRNGYNSSTGHAAAADVLQLSADFQSVTPFYHETSQALGGPLIADQNGRVFTENRGGQYPTPPCEIAELTPPSTANGFFYSTVNTEPFGLASDGSSLLVGAFTPTTADNSAGTTSVTAYPYASVTSGSGAPGSYSFSSTGVIGGGDNGRASALGRDAQGYIYQARGPAVLVFAPGTSGTNAKPIGALFNGYDPTTADNLMVVPAGLVAPPVNNVISMAVQP